MARLEGELIVSPLAILECVNAVELRVFRGDRTAQQASDSIRALSSDLTNGVYRRGAVPASAWRMARDLSRRHTASFGARSLDILHVATALAMKAQAFLTFDRIQGKLAKAEGLVTAPKM